MGRPLSRPRKPAAPDRAASLARSLVEGRIRLPVGGDGRLVPGSFRRYIDGAFPGISQDEVARGIAIAAEVVASDKGYPR